MPVPPLSRRTALQLVGVSALTLLAGCIGGDDGPDTPGGQGNDPDPDLALLATAVTDKQDLLAAYEAAATRHPQLGTGLKPLREDHAAHLAALTSFRPDLPAPEPSASASPTAPSTPTSRDQAVESLATAELAAAGRRIGQCRNARDPELARLLASIGGCEAAHTAMLRAGAS